MFRAVTVTPRWRSAGQVLAVLEGVAETPAAEGIDVAVKEHDVGKRLVSNDVGEGVGLDGPPQIRCRAIDDGAVHAEPFADKLRQAVGEILRTLRRGAQQVPALKVRAHPFQAEFRRDELAQQRHGNLVASAQVDAPEEEDALAFGFAPHIRSSHFLVREPAF